MNKYFLLVLSFLLTGCGTSSSVGGKSVTLDQHYFAYQNQTWELKVPSTWEILDPEESALFMARNGDENIVILSREARNTDPAQQIITSAQNQFFRFELKEKSDSAWQFLGQPSVSNPPRLFWQQIKTLPLSNQFLLASCSRHASNAEKANCPTLLKSWKVIE